MKAAAGRERNAFRLKARNVNGAATMLTNSLVRIRSRCGAVVAVLTTVVLVFFAWHKEPEVGIARDATTGGKARSVHRARASDARHLKLAFVTNNTSDFWKIAAAGVQKYERESGVQVDVRMLPNGTVQEQNTVLDDLVIRGYDGIAISVVAPNEQVSKINDIAKTANVICFDADCPGSNRLFYIGTDNFEAGKVMGGQIVRLLPHGGKIALFVGRFSADNAKQRLNGMVAAISGHNIEIVEKMEDGTDPATARSNVDAVIRAHDDLDMLCGLWSYNGPAIAAAIKASGKQGKLIAVVFDEAHGTLDGIKSGLINCTIVQKPFQFGYLSSRWLHELATKGPDAELPEDGNLDTGVRLIDATSVDAFEEEMKIMNSGP
jgi:ribose transport system substrate-binding protein